MNWSWVNWRDVARQALEFFAMIALCVALLYGCVRLWDGVPIEPCEDDLGHVNPNPACR
jgi:hypothetical protein